MKKIVEEKIPESIRQDEIYYCDLCGKKIYSRYQDGCRGIIYVNEKESCHYPECWYEEGYIYDLCNECVGKKIIPLIKKELKIKPRFYKESDFDEGLEFRK